MKEKVIILIMVTFLISGCSQSEAIYTNNTLPADNQVQSLIDENRQLENEKSSNGDIEEDVNASDLQEDENLTEIAEEEHKTEEDVLVPQEEVEEEKQDEQDEIEELPSKEDEAKDIKEEQQEGQPQEEQTEDGYIILNTFDTKLPSTINLDIKYDKYPTSHDYFLVLGSNINVREKPTTESRIVKKSLVYEKLNLDKEVKGQYIKKYNSDRWYRIFWKNNDKIEYGYVFGLLGEPRKFQFDKMEESINKLKDEVDNHKTAYISNYKDRNGRAPLYKGKTVDDYGIKRYQAAPAYLKPQKDSEFRYISDGTLVTILDQKGDYFKIRTLNFEGEYWIPKKFVTTWNSIKNLTKTVVVDRKNQNQGVFEYRDGKWNLISYVFATTGAKSKYKEETSLGYYMVIQTRDRFLYLHDETREIDGYAPYAVRFNGGAYIHGVPVNFKIVEDERIDPGIKEYLYTIGSIPRSHKCVRNYTSHAKFLYDWVEIGKSAVIVIE